MMKRIRTISRLPRPLSFTGIPLAGCLLLSILLLPLLVSCAGTPVVGESGASPVVVLDAVPFFPQEDYQCGPASLAGVLNYWGKKISPEEIAAALYSPTAKGILGLDLVLYARKQGFKVSQYSGGLEDIRQKMDSKQPLILMVDYGLLSYQVNHFLVAVGYDAGNIIVNSGRKRHQRIPREEFSKIWRKTKFWTLLITP